jgi:hypothetical protein
MRRQPVNVGRGFAWQGFPISIEQLLRSTCQCQPMMAGIAEMS